MANGIEIDVDYIDDVQVTRTSDDDHQNYPLPYLLDGDQHPWAKKQ